MSKSSLFAAIVCNTELGEIDLSMKQAAILELIYGDPKSDPGGVKELAERLQCHKPGISRALDRLEQFKLVQRQTNPVDRRTLILKQTDDGKAIHTTLRKIIAAHAK